MTRSTPVWRRPLTLTSSSIYGLVVASAVLVAADDTEGDIDVFWRAVVTIVGVWIAHVFSEVVAGPSGEREPIRPVRRAVRHAIGDSIGMLLAAVPPLVILLLGGVGLIEEYAAYYAALVVTLVLLSVMGWVAVARRGARWPARLGGALATAAVGAVVIIVKAALH